MCYIVISYKLTNDYIYFKKKEGNNYGNDRRRHTGCFKSERF